MTLRNAYYVCSCSMYSSLQCCSRLRIDDILAAAVLKATVVEVVVVVPVLWPHCHVLWELSQDCHLTSSLSDTSMAKKKHISRNCTLLAAATLWTCLNVALALSQHHQPLYEFGL